jgi:phosphonate degradation associated HDIG domain protein
MNEPSIVGEILGFFRDRGNRLYGEAVTQSQHALQTAAAAKADGAPDYLVVAALLHDVGHVLSNLPEDAADHDIDDVHEQVGAAWLGKHFPARVVEPVRMHVDAKRYLCTADPGYFATLSGASVKSLALQGGPMSESEAAEFRRNPHFEDAIRLRRYDERGKNPEDKDTTVESYRAMIAAALQPA